MKHPMPACRHEIEFRVCYSETDQMGTYYNSRPLEWFERGRTELCRAFGKPYRQMERLGIRMPVYEAHVTYRGTAEYDDLLKMTTVLSMEGKARLRFDVRIIQAETGQPICDGWTLHAVTNTSGKPIRPPIWLSGWIAANSVEPSE